MSDEQALQNRPRVGIGVTIFQYGKVLPGKRKGSFGALEYATPGGHLEYMESFEDCARREVREECGLEIGSIRFLCVANVKRYDPLHYVHIGLAADWVSGEPNVLEPHKCEGWAWYDVDQLPMPLFEMTRLGIESHKNRKSYFDA